MCQAILQQRIILQIPVVVQTTTKGFIMTNVIRTIREQLNSNQRIAFDMLLEIDPSGLNKAMQTGIKITKYKDMWSNGGLRTNVQVLPEFKRYLRERF